MRAFASGACMSGSFAIWKPFAEKRGEVKLGVTFVMMKENLHELEHINAFADRFDADMINLSHVVPDEPVKEADTVYDLPYKVGRMYRFDPSVTAEKEWDLCPFIRDEACFIRADGEVTACMQLLHNSHTYLYGERRRVFAHSYGNINREGLASIWESDAFVAFRQRVRNFEFPCCTICMGCEDRKENIADCMYNDSPTCGACLWAQGLIRCP